ncbi:helix-turn-helix domain-containing protein [Bosea sp. RAC05]|uniref:helix-turn-helix domain-containing protein n=1 Tax=Bosea sp. RAC05 TaxID=1842539 RepID=UPI000858EE79|nr:hypothetical protein [Bosea sp. RAC05]AOG02837.1 hypothetical protein BSY19_5076 [Bosea sp. RAC05]
MDGDGFKAALSKLGVNQAEFARRHNLSVRTVQNWAGNGPPEFIVPFFREMVRYHIQSPSQFPGGEETVHNACTAIDAGMHQLVLTARRAGWDKKMVLAAMINWVSGELVARSPQE